MAQWEPFYYGGQEGFMTYAAETGILTPKDAPVIGAPGTQLLAGLANVPGYNVNDNTAPVRGAGAARAVTFLPMRREFTIDNQILLSAGAATKLFLQSALRATPNATIANANRHLCLPLISVGGGAIGACDTARTSKWLARYAMFNTLTLTFAENQPATAAFQLWPLYIEQNATYTVPAISETSILAVSGQPFAFQHLSFSIGATQYETGITSATISVNNKLRRVGTRNPVASDPTSRAARQIVTDGEDVTINLSMNAPLEFAGETTIGTIVVALTDGVSTITITVTANWHANSGQNSTAPDGAYGYSASILSSSLAIT